LEIRNYLDEILSKVEEFRPFLDSSAETFRHDVFCALGVSVIRNLFNRAEVESARDSWLASSGSGNDERKLRFNPVENLDLTDELLALSRHANVINIMQKIFGPNIGVFKRRVVAKDGSFSGSIFLHQDSGYQRGTLDKLSLFIALTDIHVDSGGLEFWLSTNRFGYLDDAGEISRQALPGLWPVYKPILQIGDAVLMDSRVWHGSNENTSGKPRIMTDFIYQSADCPSSMEVLDATGVRSKTKSPILFDSPTLFTRSRVSTITELNNKIEGLKIET